MPQQSSSDDWACGHHLPENRCLYSSAAIGRLVESCLVRISSSATLIFVRAVYNRLARCLFLSTSPVRSSDCVMDPLFQLTSAALPTMLMLLNNSVETTNLSAQNDTLMNVTVDATPLKMPTDFPSLFTFIYSISALRDYLKLIMLGGAFETLRRLYSASYRNLMDRLFITATFESEDASYGEHPFPQCCLPN
jgi:hypothetical protein